LVVPQVETEGAHAVLCGSSWRD